MTTDPTSIKTVPASMPFEVLMSTWERQPQLAHSAGLARSDQRFASSEMLCSWQHGQALFIG